MRSVYLRLMYTCQPRGIFISFERTGHYLILKLIRKLYRTLSQGWSLTQDGILTQRQRVITKQRPQEMKVPNSQGLKIIATQVSAKLTGYEHIGATFSPPCDPQLYTRHKRKKGRGPNPVHSNMHVRSLVSLGL